LNAKAGVKNKNDIIINKMKKMTLLKNATFWFLAILGQTKSLSGNAYCVLMEEDRSNYYCLVK